MSTLPGFVGPAYQSQSRILAGERCINFYPEIIETPVGKARAALYPCPGLSTFATLTDSPGRGLLGENGRLFAVVGGSLNEISRAGVVTPRGAVAVNANPAQLATNGDGGQDVAIASGGNLYILDLVTNVLTLEADAGVVTMVGQLDGFFVGLDTTTSTMKISESLDGKTWDPTQIAQRTAASDPWLAQLISRREIFLLGERTGEVWYNAGLAPFPFAQRSGAFFEVGIEAPFSLARFGQTMAWLGRSALGTGIVYWMNGYTPNRISNHAVEWAIRGYTRIDDAIGWSYEQQGHSFYVLDFPTPSRTWVYDAMTNQWHERGRWSSIANDFVAYRPRFHAQIYDRTLACDSQGSGLFAMSSTIYTDVDGGELRRVRRSPHLPNNEHRRRIFSYFEVEAERGVGLAAGQGSNPQIVLRYSNDGGQTWGSDRPRSAGEIGEYSQRIRWDRCGSGRDRVWEIWMSDPVPFRLGDAYVGVV